MKKRMGHIRSFLASLLQTNGNKMMKNEYPIIPQTGTGMPINIEYGLCETVSQFIDLEMAQKLSYAISV